MPGVDAKQQAILYVLQKYGELTDDEIVQAVWKHQPRGPAARPFTDKQVRESRAMLVARGFVKQGSSARTWVAT